MSEHKQDLVYITPVEVTKKPTNPNYRPYHGAQAILDILRLKDKVTDLTESRDVAAAHAFSYAERMAKERQRANYDLLTGLGSLNKYVHDLGRFEQRASRDDRLRVGLLLLDADGLKRLNDHPEGGHEAGDRLLKLFANSLEESVRVGDTAYRLSGDEFAVLMPINELEGDVSEFTSGIEHRFKDALEQSIATQEFPEGLYLGISVGFGVLAPGEDKVSLMKRVDGYLYANKEAGKEKLRSQGITFQDSRLLANEL